MMHSMSAKYETVLALCKAQSTVSSKMAGSDRSRVFCSASFGVCEVNRCDFPHLP